MNHVLCSPENRCWHIFVGGQPSRIDGPCWTCSDAGRGMGKKKEWGKSARRHLSRSSTGREASDRPIGRLRDALARAEETLLGRLPVDDMPDVLDIGSLAIEILLW